MAVFKTLKNLKDKVDSTGFSGGGLSKENFLSLKSGEYARIFFRQEITEDGANFDKSRGAANVESIHVSPNNFIRKFVCTADNEEQGFKCWACDAAKIPGNGKLRAKRRLLINVLVHEDGEWMPKILEQSISPRGNMVGNTIISFQEEYGTLTDREYKFSRIGEKLNTTYNLIPLSPADIPAEDSKLDMIDTTKVYRVIPYEEQQEFMMDADGNPTQPASDGTDW